MRILRYENGDLGVGDSADILIRVPAGSPIHAELREEIRLGELEPADEHPAVAPAPTPPGVAIEDHGELGPTLTDPKHDFTGPDEVRE